MNAELCEFCEEAVMEYMGRLGKRHVFKCRYCGDVQHLKFDRLHPETQEALALEEQARREREAEAKALSRSTYISPSAGKER